MKKIVAKVIEYAKYPSSWKGLIAVLSVVGVQLSPATQEAIVTFGLASYGLISIFFSDSDVK